ncbi:hypothetical protein ABTB01_20145, partial [Acinetobacter baumannii]
MSAFVSIAATAVVVGTTSLSGIFTFNDLSTADWRLQLSIFGLVPQRFWNSFIPFVFKVLF